MNLVLVHGTQRPASTDGSAAKCPYGMEDTFLQAELEILHGYLSNVGIKPHSRALIESSAPKNSSVVGRNSYSVRSVYSIMKVAALPCCCVGFVHRG